MTLFEGRLAGAPVLVTGSTGFKGAWLCAWLARLGARVSGAALPPDAPSLFDALDLRARVAQHDGDIRDPAFLERVVATEQPRVVLHLAAQALVRASYDDPAGTFATNVQGTVHLLEAVRRAGRPCAVLVVTSDKCYENLGWEHGYRETDALGGHDPYSASKACAELVAQSYRRAFFAPARLDRHQVALASARAGNVIGPGDWAKDRIIPDAVRALSAGQALQVRAPRSTRPWQHVLDALSGYLALAAKLLGPDAAGWTEAWNFGPTAEDARPVRAVADAFCGAWGAGARWEDRSDPAAPHEAAVLRLSSDKAVLRLGWRPAWGFDEAVRRTAAGYRALLGARDAIAARGVVEAELEAYEQAALRAGAGWAPTPVEATR